MYLYSFLLPLLFLASIQSAAAQPIISLLNPEVTISPDRLLSIRKQIRAVSSGGHYDFVGIIQVRDVFRTVDRQGFVELGSYDGLAEPLLIRTHRFEYEGDHDYRFSGTDTDERVHVSLVRQADGISGFIEDYRTFSSYSIVPSGPLSLLFKLDRSVTASCGSGLGLEKRGQKSGACTVGRTNFCDDLARVGHIDIHFLLNPEAQQYFDQLGYTGSILHNAVNQMESIFSSNSIPHKFS